MRKRYFDTSRGQIHYVEDGTGPTVVLLHQLPVSSVVFTRMIPLLSSRYHVIAPDFPGFGGSDRLPEGYSMLDVAAVLAEVVASVGKPKARLFGVHGGTVIAAEMARNHPELVESVVLAGYPYLRPEEREQRIKWTHDQAKGLPGGVPITIPQADGTHFLKRWHFAYREVWLGQGHPPAAELSPDEMFFANQLVIWPVLGWEAAPEAFRVVYAYDSDRFLPQVNVPALVMHTVGAAERDHLKRSQLVAELLPQGSVTTISDADPFFVYWKATEVCGLMTKFWDSLH